MPNGPDKYNNIILVENKVKELGNEFAIVDFYIDDGYTGLNTNRPAFQKMLKD